MNEYNIISSDVLLILEVSELNGYTLADEIAKRWDISIRQVQYLCKHGRIDGAVKFGNTWAIPENAEKPTRTSKLKSGRKPKRIEKF